ncbi:BRCT domain protein [Aspergillus luchuensis]|uniref:Uncharacterized protein n=1 Tax=Aspergillus kawachii TaxID=1069201 RepID=A0A7R7ZXU6_ASPKA|nr:uncharacterized protein AKAW2_30478S [Aspergillus luchuensis]BCR97159.1 hypothetical protein AKAW2_30478S [Aspergillus luchuensis]BCS09628.1 hypothetical protein ALUC_30445S [Aspergillus luchuensis]
MGKTFKNIHASSFGKFDGLSDKIPQWIRANGGQYSKDISKNLTHMITTKEAFKDNVEAGNLKNQDPFGRKRKGVKAGTAVSRYHIYTDEEARVTYNATLVRLMQGKSCKERYVVRVYESNREPHVYATHLEYSRIGKQQSQLLTPLKADRDFAVTAFKETFKDKTGKEWEGRLDDILPEGKRDTDGKILPPHQNWFYYEDQAGLLSNFLRGVDAPDGDGMVTVKQDYLDASLQGIEHESAQDGNGERPGSDEPIIYTI